MTGTKCNLAYIVIPLLPKHTNMHKLISVFLLLSSLFLQQCSYTNANDAAPVAINAIEYVCLPCGYDCDSTLHNKPGTCDQCKMELVNKSAITFSNINAAALYSFIKTKGKENVLLLDVRTAEEFSGIAPDKFGRLKDAVNIPVQQLKERLSEIERYKDKEIIVYCSHSHRSPAASYLLTQNGFKKVSNLQHGMYLWKQNVTDKESNDSLYVSQ